VVPQVKRETLHSVVVLCAWLLGCLEVIVGVLVLSWSNLPPAPTPVTADQLTTLKYATLCLCVAYFGAILYKWLLPIRFGRHFEQVQRRCAS
jgi:hypothetical protein